MTSKSDPRGHPGLKLCAHVSVMGCYRFTNFCRNRRGSGSKWHFFGWFHMEWPIKEILHRRKSVRQKTAIIANAWTKNRGRKKGRRKSVWRKNVLDPLEVGTSPGYKQLWKPNRTDSSAWRGAPWRYQSVEAAADGWGAPKRARAPGVS